MTTTEILQEAIEKLNEVSELIEEAKKNKSLDDYYGYSMELMLQEINKISNNSHGYMTMDTNIDEIIEGETENKWEDEEHDYEG